MVPPLPPHPASLPPNPPHILTVVGISTRWFLSKFSISRHCISKSEGGIESSILSYSRSSVTRWSLPMDSGMCTNWFRSSFIKHRALIRPTSCGRTSRMFSETWRSQRLEREAKSAGRISSLFFVKSRTVRLRSLVMLCGGAIKPLPHSFPFLIPLLLFPPPLFPSYCLTYYYDHVTCRLHHAVVLMGMVFCMTPPTIY